MRGKGDTARNVEVVGMGGIYSIIYALESARMVGKRAHARTAEVAGMLIFNCPLNTPIALQHMRAREAKVLL